MGRYLTRKKSFGNALHESESKNSYHGSTKYSMRKVIASKDDNASPTQKVTLKEGGRLDAPLNRSSHNFFMNLAEEYDKDLFDDENDLLPHQDNVVESERATFMSTLTNEHALSVDMTDGLSSESVPIVIGIREIGEKSGNQSKPDFDEEDPKHKRKLRLSSGCVKMFSVIEKRPYVENYLLCNACNFRIPIPKKGFSTFLDIASGMIALRKHFKAIHKEDYKALKFIPPLPEPPKSRSKKGRPRKKQSGAVKRRGRPKWKTANE
ncbi:unnamed protein product [Orchesella dallaii]|uniref:Uncharacterized protein n=1 Tax=Orchesella dallaii TaxID=48710 RepID=A0ABP1QJY0_9HEXA